MSCGLKIKLRMPLNVKNMQQYIFTIFMLILCFLDKTWCSKCSYSFVVNEMDPKDCPCLMNNRPVSGNQRTEGVGTGPSENLDTKTWIPQSMANDLLNDVQLDGNEKNSHSNSIKQVSGKYATQADTSRLETQLDSLQKQYELLTKQMKELEINMYKESALNSVLKNQVDKQTQTLKDFRYITERVKSSQNQYTLQLNQNKMDFNAEIEQVNSNMSTIRETLQKHEDYLLKHLDMMDREKAATRRNDVTMEEDTRMFRHKHQTGKRIAIKSAPNTLCHTLSKAATKYKDCQELYERGHTVSGVYYITLDYTPCPIPVYCDMETKGGGWLVIQRRKDASQNFNRSWSDYRKGFGDMNGEFWLGNDNIFLLTNQASYKLRIDLWDFNNSHKYAEYMYFKIGGERDKYRLSVLNFTGTVKDGLSHHNGMLFSTPDEDNDTWAEHHCAHVWSAGWWFDRCWYVILNGWYFNTPDVEYRGISWNPWKAEQLQRTEMKIMPSDYM